MHEKGLQRQIGFVTLVSCQERRALFVPLINRWSTADFVPPSVFLEHALYYKSLQRQIEVSTLVSSQALLVLLITGYQPRFNCGFCLSIGLHRISLIRASRGTRRRSIHRREDRMEGKRVCFLLGEQSHRRRPVLPVPARPRRLAVCAPVLTRPGNVRVLDSTGPEQLYGVVCNPETPISGYSIGSFYGSLCIRGLTRVSSLAVNSRTSLK